MIHPAFQQRLLALLPSCAHEGELSHESDSILLRVSESGATLTARVAPSGDVRHLAYRGTLSDAQRGLLELVCRYGEGKPIQECSDHAVIHVLAGLRDPASPPPVAGIVLPENAGPAFALPLRLIRALFADWRRVSRAAVAENVYDQPSSPSWRGLTTEERAARIQHALEGHELGQAMAVVRLESLQRVVVKFLSPPDSLAQQRWLMRAEAHLKETVEPTLQVYLEPKLDQNRLRQGKGVTR